MPVRHLLLPLRPILLALLAAAFMCAAALPARAIETPASYMVLMDYDTGDVLYSKNGDQKMAPASMSKLMTMVMLFDAIEDGRVSLDDEFVISENAWRKGGAASGSSTMFAKLGSRVPVKDLIRGVIVQSGNDACIAIAEGLAGSEQAFAERMTERAKEIGLKNSHFVNATGWPDEGQVMTAEDLATLARYIITNYPEFYQVYSIRQFTWNGITQQNRNPLLYMNMNVDGLKTGHTSISGYGLTASAKRNGRRLILVVNGLESERQRADESARLMDWAFREFKPYKIADKGEKMDDAPVWQGEQATVPLVVDDDINVTMSISAHKDMKVVARYDSPLQAPVAKGQQVGTLEVSAPDTPLRSYPLFAGANVPELGLFGKAMSALSQLISGE